jgi:hypothetical protein
MQSLHDCVAVNSGRSEQDVSRGSEKARTKKEDQSLVVESIGAEEALIGRTTAGAFALLDLRKEASGDYISDNLYEMAEAWLNQMQNPKRDLRLIETVKQALRKDLYQMIDPARMSAAEIQTKGTESHPVMAIQTMVSHGALRARK